MVISLATIVSGLLSMSVTINFTGQISSVTPSVFDYKIYKSGTTVYRSNWVGTVQDQGSSFSTILNNALSACNSKGRGSIYVVANNYTTTGPIGSNAIYGTAYSNILLFFQSGTVVTCASGSGPLNHVIDLENVGSGTATTNFTLTSDGTVTFDGAGRANLLHIQQVS